MATVNPTITHIDEGIDLVSWTLTTTDDGAPYQFPQWADRSIHVYGTFNAGTVVIEGSNESGAPSGANWVTLRNAQGTALSITAVDVRQIAEVTNWIRPRASVAVTSTICNLLVRRQQPLRT